METKIFIKKTSPKVISSLFKQCYNIRFYDFISEDRCKMIVRHSNNIQLKESATYTLNGLCLRLGIKN